MIFNCKNVTMSLILDYYHRSIFNLEASPAVCKRTSLIHRFQTFWCFVDSDHKYSNVSGKIKYPKSLSVSWYISVTTSHLIWQKYYKIWVGICGQLCIFSQARANNNFTRLLLFYVELSLKNACQEIPPMESNLRQLPTNRYYRQTWKGMERLKKNKTEQK